jgi:uncharacterized protein YeaO (DUF488 family)
MPLETRRWNDPMTPDDSSQLGFRLLVCRLRPRGVSKQNETWDAWWPELGPSILLLDAFHGKGQPAITWSEYAHRYMEEMQRASAVWRIRDLARRIAEGERVTLLCSSACVDPERCHRTLLARLVTSARPPRG